MAHTLQKLPENKTKFLQNGLITENANIYSCKFISFYSITRTNVQYVQCA